ncbi:hypothetical protein RRG08_002936 [Elysia crispata]|uniref:Uncharacterized protein n=1 Tax=Elysia crispata TaxID=231223 RepID=A0AAE1E274_9GAST|nr:hypothetical protein RRG08_002936 [Elysia crispata]
MITQHGWPYYTSADRWSQETDVVLFKAAGVGVMQPGRHRAALRPNVLSRNLPVPDTLMRLNDSVSPEPIYPKLRPELPALRDQLLNSTYCQHKPCRE